MINTDNGKHAKDSRELMENFFKKEQTGKGVLSLSNTEETESTAQGL